MSTCSTPKKPKLLGMPAARPFSLETGEQLFVVDIDELVDTVDSALLEKAGLRFDNTALFENVEVFAFNERELKLLLKKTGAFVLERRGSTVPLVDWVVLHEKCNLPEDVPAPTLSRLIPFQFEVSPRSEPSVGVSYIVSRTLGFALKRKIVYSGPHEQHHPYQERGAFQVVTDATCDPVADGCNRMPATVWGTPVSHRQNAFAGSEEARGVLIKDGDFTVAEVLPNALYILFDIELDGPASGRAIMSRVCSEAAALLSDESRYAALLKEARDAADLRQRVLFREIVEKSIPARRHEVSEDLSEAREDLAQARRAYVCAARKAFGLEQLVQDPTQIAKRFEEEIGRLQNGKHPDIERISVGGSARNPQLRVHTKPLVAYDSGTGKSHLLGRYELVFNLQPDLDVQFLNKDWHPEDCHGPHLDSEGVPCLGTIHEDLTEYIAHFEMEAAASLAIAFLQNPNVQDSQGVVVREFPVVGEGITV